MTVTLPSLPDHWERKRLKHVANVFPSNVDKHTKEGEVPVRLCNYTDVYYNDVITPDLSFMAATATPTEIARFTLKPGDVVFTKDSETADDIGIPAIVADDLSEIVCGYHLSVARAAQGITGQFIWRMFQSNYFRSYFETRANGLTRVGLGQEAVDNVEVPLPPIDEQQIITRYLDRETRRIDTLVERQERLIALLAEKRVAVASHAFTKGINPDVPTKPSGIEWLGEVPTHWTIVRLGALFFEANERSNEHLPVLSVSIHSGVSTDEVSDVSGERRQALSEDRSKYKAVLPGDLAYNMMRAWQGGFGAVTVEGAVSPAYIVARPFSSSELETTFVEGLLRTPHAVEEMRRYSKGITDFRLRLYWTEFKNMKIALPPLHEQRSILKHINDELDENAELSDRIRRSIEILSERRSALISAAVTGQIPLAEMIPDAQPEDAA